MQIRSKFVAFLTTAFVALAFVAGSVFADELIGTFVKIDVEGKKITVSEKGTDKEVEVKVTDETVLVTKKGENKINLEKVAANLKKAQDAGKKGATYKIEHDKGVASKISAIQAKKKVEADK